MLGGLALKWRWRERMRAAGPPDRPAEPRRRHQRAGLLGEVLPLLGRRAALRADGGRPLHARRRGGRRALRREHDRRRRDPRLDLRRQLRAGRRDRRGARRARARARASTSRSTSTPPPAASSRRSSSRSSSGTSASRACSRSTPPATSTGSSTPASAGRSGATRDALPRGSDLRRQLPRRPHADLRAQLLAARAARWSPSTTCSRASGATGYRARAAALRPTSRAASPPRSRRSAPTS